MAEAIGLLVKLVYLSVGIIIYTLFNLLAYFRKKNTPGNDYIFLSALCSIITLPMLFGSYPLSIATWIADWCCISSELKRIMKQTMSPIQRFTLLI